VHLYEAEPAESSGLLLATSRKEVAAMKTAMRELLEDLKSDDKVASTEMDEFVRIIVEENKIYDHVFQEMIRQVTVNMIERGELLLEIRNRYAAMFQKIPGRILDMHSELIAQRKLNRRLSEELNRSHLQVKELIEKLKSVHHRDQLSKSQAREAQQKLAYITNVADHAEQSMEAFHNLYRMQRTRLEKSIQQVEKENRLWVQACIYLITRVGEKEGSNHLIDLQKTEQHRLRLCLHVSTIISDINCNDMHGIEAKILEWREKMIKISRVIVQEDHKNVQDLSKIQKQMKAVLKSIESNEPNNDIELFHNLLIQLNILDAESLKEQFQHWNQELIQVTSRFTSGSDVSVCEDIAASRRQTQNWIDIAQRVMRRNRESNSGKEYESFEDKLEELKSEIYDWAGKLEARVTGEDGIVNFVSNIQGILEDR
jgi:uncharacterized membrane protein YgaE (UPF0421/DUF939 family)